MYIFFKIKIYREQHYFYVFVLLAQGPSGPDLAPRTRKVPARRSPESSEPMLFETRNHLKPLETPWSLIWGLLATLATFSHFGDFLPLWQFFATLANFCHFGKFLPNLVAVFGHINFTDHGSTSLNSFLTVFKRGNTFWLFFCIFWHFMSNSTEWGGSQFWWCQDFEGACSNCRPVLYLPPVCRLSFKIQLLFWLISESERATFDSTVF